MADRKDFRQQLTESASKVVPTLRLLTIKLLDWAIPGLESGAASLGQSHDVPKPDIWTKGRSLGANIIAYLASTANSLRTKLNPTAAELAQPLLPEPVKTELKTAWDFVQQQLVPRVISGLTWAVEWLDPKVAQIWHKVTSIPQVAEFGSKVQQNPNWQKLSTAIAPVGRFLVEISLPKSLHPLLAKRAAMWAIGITFSLFFILKPSHSTPLVAVKPLPKSMPQQVRVVDRNIDDFLPPEQGDSSISPEQIMVTDIQSQVIAATNRYGEALIQSVQTNFKLGRLVIQLTDAWYQLTPNRQEQLLDDLLDRAQSLRFKKLVIADSDRHLIARSPVIGSEMVILRR
jgi:hypothetical protein